MKPVWDLLHAPGIREAAGGAEAPAGPTPQRSGAIALASASPKAGGPGSALDAIHGRRGLVQG